MTKSESILLNDIKDDFVSVLLKTNFDGISNDRFPNYDKLINTQATYYINQFKHDIRTAREYRMSCNECLDCMIRTYNFLVENAKEANKGLRESEAA